jgi:hypothetical protein
MYIETVPNRNSPPAVLPGEAVSQLRRGIVNIDLHFRRH